MNMEVAVKTKDVDDVTFYDLFDLDEIQRMQDTFALATGVASIITEIDGTPITQPSNFCNLCQNIIRRTDKGLTNCMHSDAIIGKGSMDGPTIQRCLSGGLWDAGVQLKAKGRPIANWLIGQVRDESIQDEDLLEYAREIGADVDAFQSALQEVTIMSREQFEQIAQALYEIVNQLSALAASNLEAHQRASEQEKFQQQIIEAQKEALKELSSPIVPVLEGVVVMPLIGTIDTSRSQVIIETLLESIVEQKARVVLIDITGVPIVDTSVANYILHMTNAARLLGSEAILVGISPEVAQTIVSMGVDLSGIKTRGNLQAGVEYALRVQGWKIERE